jgi:dihydroflavonol-4-reductase
MSLVLVTGGSGFIGGHCIQQTLAAGHSVRATLRNAARGDEVRRQLEHAGSSGLDRLSFAAADLERDAGWPEAVAGCDFVLHVASPFPSVEPKNEEELIKPARDGAIRVLKAAGASGVKRVVMTSSVVAVSYGHAESRTYDEADWTNIESPDVTPYPKSKTIAERAAWDFVAKQGGPELATVNPSLVMGPALGPDASTSVHILRRLLNGEFPALPRISFGVVDVRDVADLHLRAMIDPRAKGERFIATAGDFISMREIALTLKARLGEAARRVPTRELPDWVVRLVALLDPSLRQVVPELGKRKNVTSDKAKRLLGWSPRSREDAVVATAESLIKLGLVKR